MAQEADGGSSSTEQELLNLDGGESETQELRPVAARESSSSTRATRVAKPAGPLDVIDGKYFQAFMMAVIGLNTLAISGETDHPEWPVWNVLDNIFLSIFLAELALRIQQKGLLPFLRSKKERWWNLLDTVIVLLGIVDLWVAPVVMGEAGEGSIRSGGSSILRVLRLLRLLRLLRVFKLVRKLAAFIEALTSMLSPFFLVIAVLFGFNLFMSIALTQSLGHAEAPDDESLADKYDEEVRAYFRDVPTSFFSLFQVITMDNWNTIAEPVIEQNQLWRIFFVVFITFCSWTMISILTAVASDNVISATTGKQEQEKMQKERKTKEFYRLLRAMFFAADEDGNSLLDKEEFRGLLETDQLKQLLTTFEIHVTKEELYDMWDTIDVAGTGVLTIDEFVDGLAYLQEDEIMTRHIASLDFSIRRLQKDMCKRLNGVAAKASASRKRNQVLLDALRQQEQVMRQQNVALWFWQQWAAKKDPGSFTPEAREFMAREAQRGPPSLECGHSQDPLAQPAAATKSRRNSSKGSRHLAQLMARSGN